jgi:hypothetical protein
MAPMCQWGLAVGGPQLGIRLFFLTRCAVHVYLDNARDMALVVRSDMETLVVVVSAVVSYLRCIGARAEYNIISENN